MRDPSLSFEKKENFTRRKVRAFKSPQLSRYLAKVVNTEFFYGLPMEDRRKFVAELPKDAQTVDDLSEWHREIVAKADPEVKEKFKEEEAREGSPAVATNTVPVFNIEEAKKEALYRQSQSPDDSFSIVEISQGEFAVVKVTKA